MTRMDQSRPNPFLSFFSESAQQLWKTSTSVSSQGRARGRAKGLLRIKNLHRGQMMGFGKKRVNWPGLTTSAMERDSRGLVRKKDIGQIDKESFAEYEDGVAALRTQFGFKRKRRMTPLERGWTSASPQGKKFGQPLTPDPAADFSGFESILVEFKMVSHMTGNFGKVRLLSQLMLTGNGKGMAGFALTKQPTGRGGGFQRAVNRAGLKLTHIDLYEGRTVYHDIFTQFGETKLYIHQRPNGFGIKAQRVIEAACKVIGIKDIEVKIEGSRNYNKLVKAFFLGLMRQRTHQDLADEKGLHLVELRAENDNFPRVVASPKGKVRTAEELLPNEILDYDLVGVKDTVI